MRTSFNYRFLKFVVIYVQQNKNVLYFVTIKNNNYLTVYFGNNLLHKFYISDHYVKIITEARKKHARKLSL